MWQCPDSDWDKWQHDNIKINSNFLILTSWLCTCEHVCVMISFFNIGRTAAGSRFKIPKYRWKQRLSIFSYHLICLSIVSQSLISWWEWWVIRLSSPPGSGDTGGDVTVIVWCHTLVMMTWEHRNTARRNRRREKLALALSFSDQRQSKLLGMCNELQSTLQLSLPETVLPSF